LESARFSSCRVLLWYATDGRTDGQTGTND